MVGRITIFVRQFILTTRYSLHGNDFVGICGIRDTTLCIFFWHKRKNFEIIHWKLLYIFDIICRILPKYRRIWRNFHDKFRLRLIPMNPPSRIDAQAVLRTIDSSSAHTTTKRLEYLPGIRIFTNPGSIGRIFCSQRLFLKEIRYLNGLLLHLAGRCPRRL